MASVTINASTPSTSVNLAVLMSLCDKIIGMYKRNEIKLGQDEFLLLNELRYAVTTGAGSANTVSSVVVNY